MCSDYVWKLNEEEYVSKAEEQSKKGKKSMAVLNQMPISDSNEDSIVITTVTRSDEIVMVATLDTSDRLVGLELEHCAETPRLLFQVIGLCIPFCPFLTSLSLRLCGLDGTVLHEIAKYLPHSNITNLCLDDSPIVASERCYYSLLEQPTKLRSLSLARCSLTDDDCALIISKIMYPMPASKTLIILNLTNNFISNVGARTIGDCLRANRTLQYLNLAGNQISDTGAANIINSLAAFPMTADEIVKKRQRYMDFLKTRMELFDKFYTDLTAVCPTTLDDASRSSKRRGGDARNVPVKPGTNNESLQKGKRSSRDIVVAKAQMMAENFLGSYYDPFCASETFFLDNFKYSIGNMALCWLNLAYNNLSYLSLKKLVQVVKYQSTVKSSGSGLLQVQLQGNDLPECRERYVLQELLELAVMMRTGRTQASRRLKGKK